MAVCLGSGGVTMVGEEENEQWMALSALMH
jgi:hypothetical protein